MHSSQQEQVTSVAVIGECMLELTHVDRVGVGCARPMSMSYGGDTLNTAIYLSRHQVAVSYVTGLGDDANSDWLLGEWQAEGIDCSLIRRMSNSVPGMYMINVAEDGERSFLYWRKGSPASRLFDNSKYVEDLLQSLTRFSHLYLSGISLAIYPSASRARLMGMLAEYRKQGGKIIFDGNYRPDLWPSVATAQQAYEQMYRISDLALPTLEDEAMLFGLETAEQVIKVIRGYGVQEIVVKMGGDGCLASHNGERVHVSSIPTIAVDTTAAGDSFNAAYLAARLGENPIEEACLSGHSLASKVIQHRGAIIPAADAYTSRAKVV